MTLSRVQPITHTMPKNQQRAEARAPKYEDQISTRVYKFKSKGGIQSNTTATAEALGVPKICVLT